MLLICFIRCFCSYILNSSKKKKQVKSIVVKLKIYRVRNKQKENKSKENNATNIMHNTVNLINIIRHKKVKYNYEPESSSNNFIFN